MTIPRWGLWMMLASSGLGVFFLSRELGLI
jgi:hypothetical protein